MNLIALDFFCGGGGACRGMQQAGFEVIGIDNKLHPNYPGHFVLADALNPPISLLRKAHFLWASPPCQLFSVASLSRGNDYKRHPDLIPATRELLKDHPFTCIENVPRAPLRKDLYLVGDHFGLHQLWRKRIFELSFFIWQPNGEIFRPGTYNTITKSMCSANHFYRRKAEGKKGRLSKKESKHTMGIPQDQQMTDAEIGEAVPPPYAKYIAEQAKQLIMA